MVSCICSNKLWIFMPHAEVLCHFFMCSGATKRFIVTIFRCQHVKLAGGWHACNFCLQAAPQYDATILQQEYCTSTT